MVTLSQLWLPILLTILALWVASTVIWMVLPWHRKDWGKLPDEELGRSALKGVPPGQYQVPHCHSHQQFKDPQHLAKVKEGPVAFITVMPSGMPSMGPQILRWVAFVAFATILAAYVASRTLAPQAPYLEVFRIVGVIIWAIFGASTIQDGIWFGRSWRMVWGMQLDALIYTGLAAGIFGAMWP